MNSNYRVCHDTYGFVPIVHARVNYGPSVAVTLKRGIAFFGVMIGSLRENGTVSIHARDEWTRAPLIEILARCECQSTLLMRTRSHTRVSYRLLAV